MNAHTKVAMQHKEFLDNLRSSGVVNMFGAVPYLMNKFPDLMKPEAVEILKCWMEEF